jgi:acyl-CoA synthetase (AMP-forming)/AMP-acid ligase II
MNLGMLLDMAADGAADRVAVGSRHGGGVTYRELRDRAGAVAGMLQRDGAAHLAAVDVNSEAVPIGLFGAAYAGVPYVPLSYRLADDRLAALLARIAPAHTVADERAAARIEGIEGVTPMVRAAFLAASNEEPPADPGFTDPEDVAVLLFTSGTSGEPKAAVLRHRHLASYVISTVEFMGAGEDEAALVSVPPYHVAGMSAVLSSVYGGRRIVYLPEFSPDGWVELAQGEAVTHAMVVPTMLGRILDVLEADGERLPALRHISYGGGRMPLPIVQRAMELLPHVDFVNAYGLTETSSTVAVLTPDDHRRGFESDDPDVRARLASVGRPLPTVEVEIRDGEVWVRGEQVSGEYRGGEGTGAADGWFRTNDSGRLDAEGYLFIEGRLDDVIVRGGENLSPGEIEDVLIEHPAVVEAAVVGMPDDEWGEVAVAVVVLHADGSATEVELQAWVGKRLRSSRVPARVEVRDELPYTETGKVLRRILKQELA